MRPQSCSAEHSQVAGVPAGNVTDRISVAAYGCVYHDSSII